MYAHSSVIVSYSVYLDSQAWLAQNYITVARDYTAQPFTANPNMMILRFGYRPHWELYLLRFGHCGAQNFHDS